jgi:hypothetical protein
MSEYTVYKESKKHKGSKTQGPDEWLPELGDILSVDIEITPTQDHKGNSLAATIICVLGSSSEKEACENRSLKSFGYEPATDYKWDMQFTWIQPDFDIYNSNGKDAAEPKRNYAVSKQKTTKAKIALSCYDYGAYSAMVVWADIPNVGKGVDVPEIWPPEVWPSEVKPPSEWPDGVWAHRKDKPDKFFINIPFDDNRNYISDAWEYDEGKDPKEDEDDDPHSDNYKGDGLSIYDEYRGFYEATDNGSQYVRTSPKKKDLFIFDDDNFKQKQWLNGYFAQLNIALHYWPAIAERQGTKVTVFSKTAHLPDQYGVKTLESLMEPWRLYWIDEQGNIHFYFGNTNFSLNHSDITVTIFIRAIRSATLPHIWLPGGDTSAWDIEDPMDNSVATSVTAHEFGHAVNLHDIPHGIIHCSKSDCIMFENANVNSPQSSFCDDCKNNVKLH